MVKVKGKVVASTRKKPVKAGSTNKSTGGIFTSKVIAIAKKRQANG